MDDDLRIGSRSEYVPTRFQLTPELQDIVDLAIEDYPHGFFLIRHGLVATRKIDDREPAKPESERPCDIVPLVIRTSMDKGLRHLLYVPTENRSLVPKIVLSANAAHRTGYSAQTRNGADTFTVPDGVMALVHCSRDYDSAHAILSWGRPLQVSIEQKAETSKHLRLSKAMHWNIVPAKEKLARPEGTIGLLPSHKQIRKDSGQEPVQFWKTTFQQDGKVDILSIIIELSPIYREPRRPGEGLG